MKLRVVLIASVLPFFMAGCWHKDHSAQKPPLAPATDTTQQGTQTATTTPPSGTAAAIGAKPDNNTTAEADVGTKPTAHSHTTPRKKPATKNTQVAENTPPPSVSALGHFSSGDDLNQQTSTGSSIATIERNLNDIKRPLDDQEQKTAQQIREFLKQAREALNSGDIDGARTLTTKAKVLLNELTR